MASLPFCVADLKAFHKLEQVLPIETFIVILLKCFVHCYSFSLKGYNRVGIDLSLSSLSMLYKKSSSSFVAVPSTHIGDSNYS